MTSARLKIARRDAIVMHPGPIIRGLEITAEVADCQQSVIVDEVRNGVPMRMAILARALGRAK
jgi:aspartate carbamoyltransferase catalytic subunit